MKNKRQILIFLFIIILAAILRLYSLANVPPGVNRDEASIGFTAYSLINTGKDEYGRILPISFQSFGDWKLPLYIYTTTLFVRIFGLSEIAVRLPSAIFGIATVGLTYYLIKILFKKDNLAFLTMVFIAISPWHIHLSRVESESNTAVFLIVCAVILFMKSFKTRSYLLVPSMILFSLTYFTYAGNHIVTTLLLLVLFILYRKDIPRTKWTIISLVLFTFLSSIIFSFTVLTADKTKLSGIGILGNPFIVHEKIELPRNEHTNPNSLFARLMHNKELFTVQRFVQNYLNSFSPGFLFINGGENSAHNIQGFGNMYIVEAIFLFLGAVYLVYSKDRNERFVLLWLLIAPVASSITKDAPHTNRMFAVFPILSLVTAFGILSFIKIINKRKIINLMLPVVIALFFINFIIYLDRYYMHFPRNEVESWGFGYKALNNILSEKEYSGKEIVMGKPETSPYIFLLFYSRYDPGKYQETVERYKLTEDGFLNVKKFGRFEFKQINWPQDIKTRNRVLVDSPENIPQDIKSSNLLKKEIRLPNGKVMFEIVAT